MTVNEIIEVLEPMITPQRQNRFREVLAQRTRHFTVAIEDVYQMHNASAIVRSCEVFGIQEAHFIEKMNSSQFNPDIALGADKWIDLYRYNSLQECITTIRKKGYQVLATTPHHKAIALSDFDIAKPTAFLLGTEKDGLTDSALQMADGFVQIPMVGFTESLNISVATAIILQHISNKLRESNNINWKLSIKDQQETYAQWLKKSVRRSDEILRYQQ